MLNQSGGGRQAGSLVQLLRDLAAEGVISLAGDAAGVAPHGVGGFEVLDREAFQRCVQLSCGSCVLLLSRRGRQGPGVGAPHLRRACGRRERMRGVARRGCGGARHRQ